jgi:hypothetical protein
MIKEPPNFRKIQIKGCNSQPTQQKSMNQYNLSGIPIIEINYTKFDVFKIQDSSNCQKVALILLHKKIKQMSEHLHI